MDPSDLAIFIILINCLHVIQLFTLLCFLLEWRLVAEKRDDLLVTAVRCDFDRANADPVVKKLRTDSVSRWLNYFEACGHLQQWKLAQQHNIFVKVRLRLCQLVNKSWKICPRLLKFCQSGKISSNLVFVVADHISKRWSDHRWLICSIFGHLQQWQLAQ